MDILGMIKGAKDKFHKFEEKKLLEKEGRIKELREDRSRLEHIAKVNDEIRSEKEQIRDLRFSGIKRVGQGIKEHLDSVKIRQNENSGIKVATRNPFESNKIDMFGSPKGSLGMGVEPRGNKDIGKDPKGNNKVKSLGNKRIKGL